MVCCFRRSRNNEIEADVQNIKRRIKDWQKQQAACQKIAEIPGVGILTATALVAAMGEANHFKSEREFAAFVGLVIVAMANKMARMSWTMIDSTKRVM